MVLIKYKKQSKTLFTIFYGEYNITFSINKYEKDKLYKTGD